MTFSKESVNYVDIFLKRLKYIFLIFPDATGEEILIDVGHCRKHCSKRKQLKRTEFERLLQENPEVDPMVVRSAEFLEVVVFEGF